MKIKVIFTGGTISSRSVISGISTDKFEIQNRLLINNYLNMSGDKQTELVISQPISILSENMLIEDWNAILDELRNTNFDNFDGIIIAHGTDTLAFTTSMLSIMLSGIKIPVVMVSSNYILTDNRANGNDNFYNAVNFIKGTDYTGVFAIYKNNDGRSIVYLGSRLKQCAYLINEFSSTTGVDFGEMVNGRFIFNNCYANPKLSELKKSDNLYLYSIEKLKPCVMIINPYTGIDYNCFTPTKNIKAILHSLYHGGTAATRKDLKLCSSIVEFAKKCKDEDIDVFVAPLESSMSDNYATTVEMKNNSINVLYDISIESAYAKLVMAYSIEDKKIRQQILTNNIFFEQIK